MLRSKEAVPALLKVLQSSRSLWVSEHIMAKEKGGMSVWVLTDVKSAAVNSLGQIGDRRAVAVLEKYLIKPPKNSEAFPGNVAYALYLINGKLYKYKDRDGKVRLFRPTSSKHSSQ